MSLPLPRSPHKSLTWKLSSRRKTIAERANALQTKLRTSEFTDLLQIIVAEVTKATDDLLGDLEGRVDALRAGIAIPEQLQSFGGSADLQQNNDRELLHLPGWLAQRKAKSTADRCCAAAA
jgi:hypothetical protein